MSATLWINEPHQASINLGGTTQFYAGMADMYQVVTKLDTQYPTLGTLEDMVETQDDIGYEKYKQLHEEVNKVLVINKSNLSPEALFILNQILAPDQGF